LYGVLTVLWRQRSVEHDVLVCPVSR